MQRWGRTLDVPVTFITTKVKVLQRRRQEAEVPFPALLPSSWFKFLLLNHPQVLLGGHELAAVSEWTQLFQDVWSRLKVIEASCYSEDLDALEDDAETCRIPIMVHGDEGRGRNKVTTMVIAVQPLVSWLGPEFVNMSG